MTILLIGLVLFFATHSIRVFAEDWRLKQIARLGENGWKGIYSLLSLAGFVLVLWSFGEMRAEPTIFYESPPWLKMIAALLMLPSFILLAASYVPGNSLKASVGHPMILAVKIWAFAHLLANGRCADLLLFGSFLIWAIIDFAASRRRDRRSGTTYPPGTKKGNLIVVISGIVAWAVFGKFLHGLLIGVNPFGS
jgi:uncharacterized membrane protein